VRKSASTILSEESRDFSAAEAYDVFLSHSSDDADAVLGVKRIMESLKLKVYVDWIDDSQLDRTKVTKKTAALLRVRMRASTCLVYVDSPNAADSAWMPWELGYFDGLSPQLIWILPLVAEYDSEFKGQEYLGLYPTIDKIAGLVGHLNLGFRNVKLGEQRIDIPLEQAAKEKTHIFLSE
jgi:hypothetical protein